MSLDPSFADVSLLLRGDGDYADAGPLVQTITTLNGSPAFSTSIKKFGSAAFDFRRTGSVRIPVGMNFGTGDFTVECWAYWNTASGVQQYGLFQLCTPVGYSTSNQSIAVFAGTGGNYGFYAGTSVATSTPIATGQWVHIAIARQAGVIRFFVNGAKIQEISSAFNFTNSAGVLGGYYSAAYNADALIDEFRVTKGVARYTANFTPPVDAFPGAAALMVAYAASPSVLAGASATAAVVHLAQAQAQTPLGGLDLFAISGHGAFAQSASPLSPPSLLAQLVNGSYASDGGPLAAPEVMTALLAQAIASGPGVMGVPRGLAYVPTIAMAQAVTMLGGPQPLAYHDFTGQIGDAVNRYVMDLVTPTGAVRVPISSWQATLQTGSSNYLQCVIPACTVWTGAINTATAFVISRRAVLPDGAAIEYEMARAPAESARFDRGPLRETCTLSGYSEAFAASENPPAAYDRALTGVRSISSGPSYRVRCAVDWLLRPGHRAFVEGAPFVVSYINYYAPPEFDAYMDVGS